LKASTQSGLSLVQLLIIMLSISVTSTVVWNFQHSGGKWESRAVSEVRIEKDISFLLDEIEYHFGLAGYGLNDDTAPYQIKKNNNGEEITIYHNDICYKYFVDSENNLIKSVEGVEKIVAANINSLSTTEIGKGTLVVEISSVTMKNSNPSSVGSMSKSYSTVVDLKSVI
jgi:hypothetical protein